MLNKQLDFLDILAIASFVVGLQNLDENLTQGDKQELMSDLDEKTERLLAELRLELWEQNTMLTEILQRLEKKK